MEKTKVISFLTKLEAEKLPIIQQLSINHFKDKDYLNIHSEDYKRLSFYIYWLLRYHFKYVLNNRTKAKFWLCYEYEKPHLWSIVDDDFIKSLLTVIFSSITTKNIDDFLLNLYTDISLRLKLDLEFERISFNWVLDGSSYLNLTTKEKLECDELHSILEVINDIKTIDSLVVLDQNHPMLTIENQISNLVNKLRNIA